MIITVKTTGIHADNLRAKRIRNSEAQFFVCLVETIGVMLIPHKNTCTSTSRHFRKHNPNCEPEISLSYLHNIPIYYPSHTVVLDLYPSKGWLSTWCNNTQNFLGPDFYSKCYHVF